MKTIYTHKICNCWVTVISMSSNKQWFLHPFVLLFWFNTRKLPSNSGLDGTDFDVIVKVKVFSALCFEFMSIKIHPSSSSFWVMHLETIIWWILTHIMIDLLAISPHNIAYGFRLRQVDMKSWSWSWCRHVADIASNGIVGSVRRNVK